MAMVNIIQRRRGVVEEVLKESFHQGIHRRTETRQYHQGGSQQDNGRYFLADIDISILTGFFNLPRGRFFGFFFSVSSFWSDIAAMTHN